MVQYNKAGRRSPPPTAWATLHQGRRPSSTRPGASGRPKGAGAGGGVGVAGLAP